MFESRARSPPIDDRQKIIDVDPSVTVDIGRRIRRRMLAPETDDDEEVVDIDREIVIDIAAADDGEDRWVACHRAGGVCRNDVVDPSVCHVYRVYG